jgi:hypothetical protein
MYGEVLLFTNVLENSNLLFMGKIGGLISRKVCCGGKVHRRELFGKTIANFFRKQKIFMHFLMFWILRKSLLIVLSMEIAD